MVHTSLLSTFSWSKLVTWTHLEMRGSISDVLPYSKTPHSIAHVLSSQFCGLAIYAGFHWADSHIFWLDSASGGWLAIGWNNRDDLAMNLSSSTRLAQACSVAAQTSRSGKRASSSVQVLFKSLLGQRENEFMNEWNNLKSKKLKCKSQNMHGL